jgi:hypothetical protein
VSQKKAIMSWNTLYITGKPGFKEKVLESLENSDLPIMPGSTGSDQDVILCWIDDTHSLHSYKKVIGSKVVFKYRLQFFNTEEEWLHLQKKKAKLSPREEAMIREMNHWQNTRDYLHSA